MPFKNVLILLFIIVEFLPVFRFYRHKYFYYVFVLGIIEPLSILLVHYLLIDNLIYIIIYFLLIFWAFPLFEIKIKILISVSFIISIYSSYGVLSTLCLVIIILTFAFICIKNIEYFIIEQRYEGKGSIYLVILSFEAIFDSIAIFMVFKEISFYVHSYIYLQIINIVQFLSLFYFGPESKMKIGFLKINNKIKLPPNIIGYKNEEKEIKQEPIASKNEFNNFQLSEREIQILELICTGMTSKEIADKLFLSKKTIDYYRASLRQKLDITKKTDLIKFYKNNVTTSTSAKK